MLFSFNPKHLETRSTKTTSGFIRDIEVRKSFSYLKFLPFVPLKDIIHAFKLIKSVSSKKMECVFDYFEEYYIGKPISSGESGRIARSLPRFPIKIWNLYDRLLTDLPRTNNSIEAWHKSFELDVKKHPTVAKLVEHFRKEQKNTHIVCTQLLCANDKIKRKKCEIEKDEHIKSIVLSYNKNDCLNYLEKFFFLFN